MIHAAFANTEYKFKNLEAITKKVAWNTQLER
jgi:hypothetical protein